ncbi:MAG TPA: GGDEF domain-containing protein [Chloroflexota bacterium]|jgi:diguanylate cyclase (GGDEF)-like protein|nr:GGDEF domain-containing protein [Chloroflexota bacterium]
MPLEDLRELRGYRRLFAITNLLVLCAFLLWAYFSLDLAAQAGPAVAVAGWALFTLGYYGLLPDRRFSRRLLFYGNLIDLLFATTLVWFSGGEASPFFFIYLLVILMAALTLGLRPCFALAAFASGLYLLVGSFALSQLLSLPDELRRDIVRLAADPAGPAAAGQVLSWTTLAGQALLSGLSRLWANVAALWLTAYVAAFFAQETARVRQSIQEAREKVEGFSRIDWLTGLYNRRHFHYLLSQEISRAERYARPLSLLLMDSDNLKTVNDTYGHHAGDHLLATLAGLLRTETRLSDTVVRYGGDEFVILLPDTDPVGARFLAERLRAAVEQVEFVWQNQRIPISVTIGLASLPQDAIDGASLIARADAALYAGKRAGRNRVVTYPEARAAEQVGAGGPGER